IGAVDVNARHRAIGQQGGQDMTRVPAEQPDVREALALGALLRQAQVLEGPLDAQEVDLRARRPLCQKEAALADAVLDLDRMRVAEQRTEIERTAQDPGENLQRARFR